MTVRNLPWLSMRRRSRTCQRVNPLLLIALAFSFSGCRQNDHSGWSASFSCCAEAGFAVTLFERSVLQPFLHRCGSAGDPELVIRRNEKANELHVMLAEKPFGGVVIKESEVRCVEGVDGPWVMTSKGDVLTRIADTARPLRFCPLKVKERHPEDDWFQLLQVVAGGDNEPENGPHLPALGYCFSVDPSASLFSGFESGPCPRGGALSGVTLGFLNGNVYEDRDSYIGGEALGYCGGQPVLARWGNEGRPVEDGLELLFVGFGHEGGVPLRVAKVIQVRHPLLQRPVELVDLDPVCRRLLIVKPKREESRAAWYVINIATGESRRVFEGAADGLFLSESWIKARSRKKPGDEEDWTGPLNSAAHPASDDH